MIRKHTEKDLEQIMSVWSQASELAHPFLDNKFVEKVRSDMRNLYVPNSQTWVFENDDVIIGFISMLENEIGGLFVRPDNHSKGIGKMLVDFIAAENEVMEVEVFEKNSIGRAFYNKYGFKLMRQYLHEESESIILRLRYEKTSNQ